MNRLSSQKSPYLLQHKDNPVHWWPWCEEAFEEAKKRELPVFLSIGYSTCYWCHVMEHDSFESEEVAQVINEKFICIKLDREERPDLDQIYMEYLIAINGHGGWPLSVFLTPDKAPFWAGTFFYKAQFISILNTISGKWGSERPRLLKAANEATLLFAENNERMHARDLEEITLQAANTLVKRFDEENGGFGGAPKFPQPNTLSFLLSEYRRTQSPDLKNVITRTLDGMADNGLFDHLGGGFHRYCVDAAWTVPHFEKMLYDNALLISLYSRAARVFSEEKYKEVVLSVLDYLQRDLGAKPGFFAAQDAGEVGEEGDYYSWRPEEVIAVLGERAGKRSNGLFGITEAGNFEHGRSVLSCRDWKALKDPEIASGTDRLLAQRDTRKEPRIDTKILTAWNGLLLTGFVESGKIEEALELAQFLRANLLKKGIPAHQLCDGLLSGAANLEDYAFLIQGFLALGIASRDYNWLALANNLQSQQDQAFWDRESSGYWFSNAHDLVVKKKDWFDDALPSSSAVTLDNLSRLVLLFPDADRAERLSRLKARYQEHLSSYPGGSFAALEYLNTRYRILVCIAEKEIEQDTWNALVVSKPGMLVLTQHAQGARPPLIEEKLAYPGYYLCDASGCSLPADTLENALRLL